MAIVNFYASARGAAGSSSLKISAVNLADLIKELSNSSPELAKLLPTCTYLLNGEACQDYSQLLVDGDNIDVLPQFAGG